MTVGSLFTGCMGLDLGLEAAGLEIAWACESDAACRRVIGRHYPDLPVYEDVRMFEGVAAEEVPRVDVIAGGFPLAVSGSLPGRLRGRAGR